MVCSKVNAYQYWLSPGPAQCPWEFWHFMYQISILPLFHRARVLWYMKYNGHLENLTITSSCIGNLLNSLIFAIRLRVHFHFFQNILFIWSRQQKKFFLKTLDWRKNVCVMLLCDHPSTFWPYWLQLLIGKEELITHVLFEEPSLLSVTWQ